MGESTLLEEFVVDIHLPFDCEFLVVQRSAETPVISLTETYHVLYNSSLQTSCVANFTPGIGFSWSSLSFFARRKDLQGITIKGAVIPYVRIHLHIIIIKHF
jgi:hypothetical protein